uniref:Uncharacterized protein n=1 Tax=Knipowitschia caucasica TaxID=637954 RepID=A0AAV2LHX0_KNICA
MESDSCDESDSGVSADFSPGSTLESGGSSTRVHKETPIEREIRRAVEREHSLRRSRGLPNQPTAPEYVEIPLRKAVFFSPTLLPTKTERCQDKDKLFAGKKMQQDIHEEAKREQDLSVVKVEQDIREAQERERELRKQRMDLYETQTYLTQAKTGLQPAQLVIQRESLACGLLLQPRRLNKYKFNMAQGLLDRRPLLSNAGNQA